jgi:dihydropteroate synthase
MTERRLPTERGVQAGGGGGGDATPSFLDPSGAPSGLPTAPGPTTIRGRTFVWGERTFVMGILNVTPDSFSGDGLLALATTAGRESRPPSASADPVGRALETADRMVAEGADLLDVGGESSRPGHAEIEAAEEIARIVPVIRAVRAAHPDVPISVDTVKPAVAEAGLEAGADLLNDVWGVAQDDALARVAAAHRAPLIVMHNRAEARYANLMVEILADLERALERAVAAGCDPASLIVDPGFGFGKAPHHNLALLRDLAAIRLLGRPILLGTSRKSTLGRVLDLPPEERLEATLATTALGIAAGVDIVRVHDVRPNVRVARMTDAVVRGVGGMIRR